MNHDATKGSCERFWIWLIGLMVMGSAMSTTDSLPSGSNELVLGVAVESEQEKGPMFRWQRVWRVKKWAYAKYKAWQAQYRQAKRASQLAQLALAGLMPLAQVVDALTAKQVRYKLGALARASYHRKTATSEKPLFEGRAVISPNYLQSRVSSLQQKQFFESSRSCCSFSLTCALLSQKRGVTQHGCELLIDDNAYTNCSYLNGR